jgi:hypothetical protein
LDRFNWQVPIRLIQADILREEREKAPHHEVRAASKAVAFRIVRSWPSSRSLTTGSFTD